MTEMERAFPIENRMNTWKRPYPAGENLNVVDYRIIRLLLAS